MFRKDEIIQKSKKLSVKITNKILEHIEEFADKRQRMVSLIYQRGIRDERVLFAMSVLPRHLFVPEEIRDFSYEDTPLPIGFEQTISQPYITAFMTEELEISPQDKVLEIGTGSGYHTAILSMLSSKVITIEYEKKLSEKAKSILSYLELADNIKFVVGDGSEGYKEEAPYDKICVSAAVPDIPSPFIEQVKENGIIVIPIGDAEEQTLCKIIKEGNGKGFVKKELCLCRFVKMRGKYGF